MAISDQLTLLNNTKQAIKTSINNRGGSVTDSTPFADYSTAIDNLPSGGSGNPVLESIDVSDFSGTSFNRAASYITDVTIPNSVTSIGSYAFQYYSSLTSVTIPSGVTSIGNYAFQSCSSLTSINIPSGVTSIGSNTFDSCSSLTSVTIPSGVTSIGDRSFKSSGLTNINIPSGVTSIEREAFHGCSSLQTVIVNAITPPTLGNNVFNNTNDCPIYVPAASVDAYKAANNWSQYASRIYPIKQVATVDGNPVYNYDLRMTSTDTITSEDMAKMPAGTSVEFAEGITWAGGATAFSNYTNLTLPSTFTTFGDQYMLDGLTTVTSKATTPPTAERNQIGGSSLTAIYVPAASVDTYKAAGGWSTHSSIIQAIPSPTPSVTSITFEQYQEVTKPGNWGDFEGCSSETNVDAFEATSSGTFDSDIKAAGYVLVEDNNGNDITSQCTFTSNDFYKWDSTQDPTYDGESEATYEWRLDTYIGDADAQNPHSATITATYGNLSDTFTIEWTTTSNCETEEPEEPEE